MIKAYDTLIQGDEDSSESDKIDGLKTCHLCGKAKCGQRRGRVNCCKCGREHISLFLYLARNLQKIA